MHIVAKPYTQWRNYKSSVENKSTVYVVFCMYKIVRINQEREERGRGRGVERGGLRDGYGGVGTMRAASSRKERGSLVKRRNNLPV